VNIGSIFGYGAAGANKIPIFARLARDLGLPFGAVYDGGKSADAERLRAEFPDAPIRVLSVPDIRDKYARDQKGRERDELICAGMFDRKGKLKPAHIEEFKEKFSFSF
jgi:hypothetical protein